MLDKKSHKIWINVAYFLVIAICIFLTFSHLTSLEIRKWDEARNAMNAVEMAQNGFSLVTTFSGEPEHWNTKPPLLIWIQASFIKMMGISVLAIRLPSALAAICFIPLLLYLKRKMNLGNTFALTCLLSLFTFSIFLNTHTFKTGDFDGLLTLFMFGYAIAYFLFLKLGKQQYIVAFFACLFLAIMTKGIAGFLFLPGILLYTIMDGKLKKTLTNPNIYLGSFAVLLSVFLYYYLRDQIDPGYWLAVVNNELGGRFLEVNESHGGPFYYYFKRLFSSDMGFFGILLPVFLVIAFMDKKGRQMAVFATCMAISHLLILSVSQTKLFWYALPEVPFYAILVGLGIQSMVSYMKKRNINNALVSLVILMLFSYPLYKSVLQVVRVENTASEITDYYIPQFIKYNMDKPMYLEDVKVIFQDYAGHVLFYLEQYKEQGGTIKLTYFNDLYIGDKVLLSHDNLKARLAREYRTTILKTEYGATLYRLDEAL